jgi:cytochrome c peroxidase
MCWLALLGCDTSRPIEEEVGGATATLSMQSAKGSARLEDMERLGKLIFADKQLSVSGTLACAGCHEERHAFTGDNRPRGRPLPVAAGAFPQLLGNRNSPTIKYMGFSPKFGFAKDGDEYTATGGQFWDGRADTLAEQAKGPFLNPREMAMPSKAAVIDQIRAARYAPLFKRVFGLGSLENVDQAYDRVAQAIEAFELTKRFQPFSSKFDAVLRGTARFTQAEARGFELFKSPQKGN